MKIAALVCALPALLATGGAQLVSQGNPHMRSVALTFDAGADRGYAPLILRTLERNHVRASFGMTGRWARANADLVRRMLRDRDQLINHTYDHRSFTGFSTHTAPLTEVQRAWEIQQTDRVVYSMAHHSTKPYFRPPYGDYDAGTLSLARRLGYRYVVMWTVDSLGWEHLSSGAILQRCLADTVPGTILLMHVGSDSQDGPVLQALIGQLRHRGYRFVTVAQMVSGH